MALARPPPTHHHLSPSPTHLRAALGERVLGLRSQPTLTCLFFVTDDDDEEFLEEEDDQEEEETSTGKEEGRESIRLQ